MEKNFRNKIIVWYTREKITHMKKNKKRIVLVEDEKTLANLIEIGLKKEGFEVKTARDGKKGLRLILDEKPDLVLLDLMLPGMKGFEILERLKEDGILPNLAIVIISNSGEQIEIERAVEMGVRDYLIKVNFNPNEVVDKVKRVLKAETDKGKKKIPKKAVQGKRILLVEDNTILADVLERKFVEKNYTIYTALNAQIARKILAEHEIDLILLDLVLPDEHGFSLLRELKDKEEFEKIPVIIVSNLGQQEEIREGLKAGAVDYIVKTNTVPEEIFKKVEMWLQKNSQKHKK